MNFMMKFILLVLQVCAAIASSQVLQNSSGTPPKEMMQSTPPLSQKAPSILTAPPSMSEVPSIHEVPPSMLKVPPPFMAEAPPSVPQAPPPSVPQAPPSMPQAAPSMSEIPPLSIPQISPSMSEQPPPSMTQTSPPSMSEAPPPSMAQAPPPSMSQAPPPSMPQAPPPSMPQAPPPPSMPQAPPPSMPQAPPPSMPQAPPPSMSKAPPPSLSEAPPSMSEIPPLSIPQVSPSMSQQPLPSMTQTSPPSMSEAPPPSMAQAPLPSMNQAPPPSMPQAPPPSMPQAPPPSMPQAPPPSMPQAPPAPSMPQAPPAPSMHHAPPAPSMPQAPPPSIPQAPPPSMPQAPPPSMSEAPPPSLSEATPSTSKQLPPATPQQPPPATPQQPPPSMPQAPPPLMPQTPPPSMSEAPPPSMPQVPPSMAQAPPPSMFEAPPSMPQAPPPSMFQAPPPSIPKIPPSVSEIPPSISQRPPPFVPQVPPSMFEAPPPSIPQIPPSMSEAPTSMSQQPRPSIPQVPPSMSEAPPSISQRPPSSLPHVPPPSLSEAPPTSMPQVPSSMSKAPPPFMLLVPPPSMSKAPPPAISEAPPPSLSETTPSMPQAPPPSMSKAPPSIPDVPPSTSHVAPPPSMPQAPPSMAQRPPSFMPGPVASPPNKSLINPPPIFPILDAPSPSNLPAPSAPEAPPPTRYHPPMSLSPSYPSPPQGPKRKPTHYASPPPNRTNITSNNHSPLKAPYVHIAPSSNNYAPPPDSSSESPPPTKSRPMPFSSPSYPPPPPGPKSKPEHYAPPPQYRVPFLSPGVSRPQTSQRMPKISIQALPPPPPNEDCSSVTCNEPLTTTPPGTPCKCVMPMQIELALGVAVYTFFPLVSELAFEIAFGVSMKSSQVRIMAANADDQDSEKTIVIIDLVPLGQTFDQFTAYMTAQRFWLKQVPIKSSLFGDYEVLYVKYPGLPPSPPLPSSSIGTNGQRHGNGGKTIKPLGVDVSNQSHNKKLNGGIIAIIVLSASVASILFCVIIWVLFFKRKNGSHSESTPPATLTSLTKSSGNAESTTGIGPVSDSLSFDQSTIPYTGSLKLFTVSEMEKATNNFEESGVLGEGGFGRVYNGILEDNTKVAVKVLTRVGRQGGREFLAEVEMLSRLHHRNLVRLIGICTEENKRCLVYELIPNGSVESHLHGTEKETGPLDWAARLKIALGAARGLAYLHEDSSPRVIHRDFKSSNILLEHDFTPKVSDFGLARTGLDEQNGHISTRVMGTFGYVAPEYAMTGHLLVKSDVYSYGVVLLELLTGRKPVDMSMPSGQENLVAWARPLLPTPEGLNLLIDPSLCTETPFESISKVAAIASMCVQPEVSHRPFMGEVVQALKLVCDECEEEPRDLGSITSPNARASSYSGPAWPERSNESTLDIETGLDSGSYRMSSSSGPLSVGRRRLEGDVLRLFSRSR